MHMVPFRAEHVLRMRVQPAQIGLLEHAGEKALRALENTRADTLMRSGVPIASAGAFELWEDRALLWAYVSLDAVPVFAALHKHALRYVAALPYRRVETAVAVDFEPGHRWVKMLGFELEAPRMRAYQPDGTDCALYARVRV